MRSSTLNVVAISQTAKLLLSSSVPGIKANLTKIGVESDGVDFRFSCMESMGMILVTFNTKCGDIFLLELAGKMPLDKSCLLEG